MAWWMKNSGLTMLFAPEGEGGSGGGGGQGTGDTPAPAGDAQSVLYADDTPKDGNPAPEGEQKPTDAPNDTPAAEWKEYVPDPAKSDEENAAAKAEHDKTKPAEGDPLDKVPEDGKYTITLSDEDLVVDEVLLGALSPAMKEAGLTGKQANTLAAAFAAHQKAQAEQWGLTVSQWAKDAAADPEIGGANWDTTRKNAQSFISQFGTPALKEYLNATGAGNHPEMIRIMAKAGAVISEDKPTGGNQGGQARDAVTVLYPDDQPKG